jgi:energy-coupling factor transporter ATP-binding protein EcfA2
VTTVENLEWSEFLRTWAWEQGEHVTLIGPTGAGKTTLALEILPRRSWVVALATKRVDKTMSKLVRSQGWRKITAWPPGPLGLRRKLHVVLWPRIETVDDVPQQRYVIATALSDIFTSGSWCVFADEVLYLTETLGLGKMMGLLLTQGRSLGVSFVGASQRPRNIPKTMLSMSTHVFLWGTSDPEDLRFLSGFGRLNSSHVRAEVGSLGEHEVLYVCTRGMGRLVRTQVSSRRSAQDARSHLGG